jgi:ABC-type glycerol-3-phosphate transport system permease component
MASTDRPGLRRSRLRTAGWYLLLTALSLVVLLPIYLTVVRALSTPVSYVEAGHPFTPVDPQWDVFGDAWDMGRLGPAMLRSLVVTVLITSAQLVTSVLAASTRPRRTCSSPSSSAHRR